MRLVDEKRHIWCATQGSIRRTHYNLSTPPPPSPSRYWCRSFPGHDLNSNFSLLSCLQFKSSDCASARESQGEKLLIWRRHSWTTGSLLRNRRLATANSQQKLNIIGLWFIIYNQMMLMLMWIWISKLSVESKHSMPLAMSSNATKSK